MIATMEITKPWVLRKPSVILATMKGTIGVYSNKSGIALIDLVRHVLSR